MVHIYLRKKITWALIILSVFSLNMFVINTIYAQNASAKQAGGQCEARDLLVKEFQEQGGQEIIESAPKYCAFLPLVNRALKIAWYFAGAVSVIALIYGGYVYMTSAGSDEKKKKAKSAIYAAIIGFAFIVGSWTLIYVITIIVTGENVIK